MAGNAIYNGAVQVTSILVNIILLPYITRILTAGDLGINAFGLSVSGYFVLFGNVGITIYGAKAIAENRDDAEETQKKFSQCLTFKTFFNVISLILFNIWVLLQGQPIYAAFNLVLLSSLTDLSWAFTGKERFDLIAFRNLLIKIVGTGLIFIFVRKESHLLLFILIQQGSLLLSNAIYWIQLKKIDLRARFDKVCESIRNVFPLSMAMFIPSIFTSVYLSLNQVMLGYLSSIEEVAIYDYPNRLVRVTITLLGVLGTVFMPRLAYLFQKDAREEFEKKIYLLCFCSLILSVPTVFLFILVATPLCQIFFSSSLLNANVVLSIVAPTIITSGLSLYVIYVSTGRMKFMAKAAAVAAISNFVIDLFLLPSWGAQGAAVSLIISELLVNALLLFGIKDLVNLRTFFENLGSFLLIGLVPFCLIYGLRRLYPDMFVMSDILQIVAIGIGYALLYGGLLTIFKRKYILALIRNR